MKRSAVCRRGILTLGNLFLLLAFALPCTAEDEDDQRLRLPEVDFYFPEAEMDFRLRGLIKGSFYEGQIRYNFIDGDISAFLKYRYYGYRNVFEINLFDTVEFDAIEQSSNDFLRLRGTQFVFAWPHTYNQRSFFAAEINRITSSKEEFRFSTNRTDTLFKIGYQLGTPNDMRSNAIVGRSQGRIENLFSAHREVGPYGFGLTGALTWGFDFFEGDFDYLRFEVEGLKRIEYGGETFTIARLHAGTFFDKEVVREDPELAPVDQLSIPLGAFFRLDGRDNLRGIDETLRGTEEAHLTLEHFIPWFVRDDRRALGANWENFYWVLYAGYGNIGFDREIFSEFGDYIADVGFGFESSLRVDDYDFFLAGIVAHAIDEFGGLEARLSVRSHH